MPSPGGKCRAYSHGRIRGRVAFDGRGPSPWKEGFYEVPHGLRDTALIRVDDANGVLLPSLVLPAAMRAGLQHLLLFSRAHVPLRRSLIFARPFFLGRAGPEIERLQTPLIVSFSGPVSTEANL